MNANQEKFEALFDRALSFKPDQRGAFLAGACGGDTDLLQRLEVLLEAESEAGSFLPEQPLDAESTGIPLTEKPGDRIGRYKLLEKIGEGGCGVVYMAEQEEPVHRRVALKVIKPGMDTRSVIARFEAETLLREAEVSMRKQLGDEHPDLARLLDNLGFIMEGQHKDAEAEALHRQGLTMSRKLLGNGRPQVSTAVKILVRTLDKDGRQAEADALRNEASNPQNDQKAP